MSEQADTEGELTFNPYDKHPHRRRVQVSKPTVSFVRKVELNRLGAVVAGKHLNLFPVRERRKGLPLSERNEVTIGEYVYKRSGGRPGSPLYGKWYKLRKGERVEDAIIREGSLENILVDSPPEASKSSYRI